MPFGFDTKQQIASYIAQERRRQSRYVIDTRLLAEGCDPALIEEIWWELGQKRRKRRFTLRWRPGLQTWVLIGCWLWAGFGLWINLNWATLEWRFSGDLNGLWLCAGLPVLIFLATLLRIGKRRLLKIWDHIVVSWIALVVAFFFYVAPVLYYSGISLPFCGRNSLVPVSRLENSQGHYYLMGEFATAPDSQPGLPLEVYQLRFYRCNTFGFDCRVIFRQDFPRAFQDDNCDPPPKFHLKKGIYDQVMVIQDDPLKTWFIG